MELKKVKKGELEVYIRSEKEVTMVVLPSFIVDKMNTMKHVMQTDDLMEVLIRTSEMTMDNYYKLINKK